MADDDEIDQPWDVIADYFTKKGYRLADARDRTIIAWMRAGNTAPYRDWVERGHVPGQGVALLIARMMLKTEEPNAYDLSDLPAGLKIDADGRTLPSLEGEVRKFLAARYSMTFIEYWKRKGKPKSTTRADALAAEEASKIRLASNVTIGESTVKQTRLALQKAAKDGSFPANLKPLFWTE